jgi:hypothetical protein
MVDRSYFRAEAPLSTPVMIDRLLDGEHSISLFGRVGGVWEATDSEFEGVSAYHWLIDTDYGSDFSDLTLVVSEDFSSVQGSSLSFNWDGRDASGRLQQPGWYTVVTVLTDSLGNRQFRSHIVEVSDLAGEQSLLVAASASPRNPRGRGDLAVWQQRSGGASWQVSTLDLSDTASVPQALTSGLQSNENPATDGRYVVWQARQPDGNWDIRMVDMEAPETVVTITATADSNEVSPVVDYPWVVYQTKPVADPAQPWQLEAFNVVTGARDLVYPGQDDQTHASLDAGRVVWRDLRDPGNGEIYFQNLESGETLRLTEDLFGQFVPHIRGHWVAWQDNRDGQVEIYGTHLLDRREVRLSSGPGNKARPFIEGDWLVYEEDTFAFEVSNLHLLNLESLQFVPLTYDAANKTRPVLVGDQLIWQEGSAEPFALRSTSLPALQATFPSSNAIAITPGMAAAYPDAFSLLTDWQAEVGGVTLRQFTALTPAVVAVEATWDGASASGDNFALQAGDFLWVEFPQRRVLDLGDRVMTAIDLQSGLNVVSYDHFPLDYTAYRMVQDMGVARTVALRMLDAANGQWRSIEVDGTGELVGPDFAVPPVAVLLVELTEPLAGWSPRSN